MRFLLKAAVAILSLTLLFACGSESSTNNITATPAPSAVQIKLPTRIREAGAINLQAVRATLETSAGAVSMSLIGDRFEGSIRVNSGTDLSFTLTIFEQVGSQRITYATYEGSSNGPVTADQSVAIFERNYVYPDDDDDGTSNLAERDAGSNPFNPLSTPANPDGGNSAGLISFTQSAVEVEEGQQLTVNVSRTGGSTGVVTASINTSAFSGLTVTPQRLTWANGDATDKAFTVSSQSNDIPGDTQTIQLRLDNITGGATTGNTELSLTVLDISIVAIPPFNPLATDGEWEVCYEPYNTPGPSPFATQQSDNEGRVVNCFKACSGDIIVDPVSDGVGWMPFAQHSCFITNANPGTYANAPVYTPRRERMALALDADLFINNGTIWACDAQNRANSEYQYVVVNPLSWLRFNSDGTYGHAVTITADPPSRLQESNTWRVDGRILELSHINTGYRNIIFFSGGDTFHIHPDTDNRLRCSKQSY